METNTIDKKAQGVDLSKFEVEAITIKLSGRKLLIPLHILEEFKKDEKKWEKFKKLVERTKEKAPAVTVMLTVLEMEE